MEMGPEPTREIRAVDGGEIFFFWFPYPNEFGNYSYRAWLLTGFSFWGFLRLFRDRRPLVWFAGAVLVLYPLVFYLVHVSLRLRLAMIWVEVLLAGYALAPVLKRPLGAYQQWAGGRQFDNR